MKNANTSRPAQEAPTSSQENLEEMGMEEFTEKMMEKVCDGICRYPHIMQQEELDLHCTECELTPYVLELINREEREGNANGMV